mmetsp:Transcript_18641/g.20266  ORF Transcript_18641/g.20266 Transcript_18641/m.20266 type:complete len:340 (-) Transcript_18641:167-1186(-)
MLVNLLLLLAFLALAFAEKAGPALNWKSVAIDTSGKYHVAAAAYNNDWDQGYPLYLSDDYGVNWRQSKSPEIDWRNVYSDSTGQLLIGYAVYNSFSSSSYPPLYISKDRGNTWETGSSTSSTSFGNDITGTNSTLWTVISYNLYYSSDIGKNWYKSTNLVNQQGNAYALVRDGAVDPTGKHRYVVADAGFYASHNSGQTYTPNYSFVFNSVETDSTGQYVFILNAATLQYSTDYASTWTVLKDFTVSGSPVVTATFLKVTSDNKYVYMLQKSSSSSTTTNLVRFTVSTKSSATVFSTTNTVNDVAVSATGNSIIVSTTASLFYTTNNSGSTWMTHTISV